MKFDSRPTDAGQIDLVVNNGDIPNVAPLTPWRKGHPAASRGAAMLAFAAGLLVAALGAGADEPAWRQPVAERTGTDGARVQPTAKQSASPNQPDISASDALTVDALYRLLMGPEPAISLDSRSTPSDDADRER